MNKLLLTLLCSLCIGALNLNAQITGDSTCININGNNLYNEHTYDINLYRLAEKAGDEIGLTHPKVGSYSISTAGGIEIVKIDEAASQVTIRSKTGTTKDSLFSRWAKGRIHVRYSEGDGHDCGFGMGLSISKHFDLANHDYDNSFQVNGPSCVAPGDTVVFSVPPLVTMAYTPSHDSYDWDLGSLVLPDESNVLYWSSDYSAVTLVAPDFGDYNEISVVLGSCNDRSHNLLTRSIFGKPAEPKISGPSCWEDNNVVTFNIDNHDTDVTYTWVVNNDTLAINSTAKSLDVDINYYKKGFGRPFRNTSKFKVTVYANPIGGSCFGAVRGTYILHKGIFKETSIAPKDSDPCFISGQQKTLEINTMGEEVVWELPQGWSGDGTAQFSNNITPEVSAENGVIKVRALYSECKNEVTYAANLKPSVESISGNDIVEAGQSYTYTASSPGAESYEWIIPEGYSYTPTNSETIELTVLGNGKSISPIQVRAIGAGECTGDYISKTIGVSPTTPTSISFKKLNGTALTCYDINMTNTFKIYTDPIDANHAFVWDLGSWGTITSLDPNSNEITVTTTVLTAGNYTVKVKSTTAAGMFESNEYSDDITITDSFSLGTTNYDSYELYNGINKVGVTTSNTEAVLLKNGSPALLNARELWWVSDRYNDIGIDTRADPTIPFPLESPYKLEVTYTQPNGCKVYKEVATEAVRGAISEKELVSTLQATASERVRSRQSDFDRELFTLYPVPTDDFVNVKLSSLDKNITSSYRIYNSSGQLVLRDEINNSTTRINVSSLNAGNYIVVVKCGDRMEEKKVVKK